MKRVATIWALGAWATLFLVSPEAAGQDSLGALPGTTAPPPASWAWPGEPDPVVVPTTRAGTTFASIQDRDPTPQDAQQTTCGVTFKSVAKWVSLAVSASSAAYGFGVNGDADGLFRELQDTCDADPPRCSVRMADGSFTDVELEQRYQEVVRLDDRARAALIVGQLGIVATAVLFILDLGGDGPPDIPYDPPPSLRVGPDGVSLSASLQVGGSPREQSRP